MIFRIPLSGSISAPVVLNRAGYATFNDPNTHETSYVKRLGNYFYPRFHIYIKSITPTEAKLSLHLDMKQPSYIPGKAHNGEYEGETVENEIRRILEGVK